MTIQTTTESIVESIPQDTDLPLGDLAQAAFTAYVDAALAEGHAQSRLEAGSHAAARAVVGVLAGMGMIRPTLKWEATHGTGSGYDAGCRCDYCTKAKTLHGAAHRHWKKKQGHNKVRP